MHAVGGIVGALLTGVFAINSRRHRRLIEGNAARCSIQVNGILVHAVYDAIVLVIILKIIEAMIGLRVSEEAERDGLDLSLHGEMVQ